MEAWFDVLESGRLIIVLNMLSSNCKNCYDKVGTLSCLLERCCRDGKKRGNKKNQGLKMCG